MNCRSVKCVVPGHPAGPHDVPEVAIPARTRVSKLALKSRGSASPGRPRIVPLWWDAGTLEGLAAWKAERLRASAEYNEPFVASLIPGRVAKTFSRHTLRKRFRTACRNLGAARLESSAV
jgi:hypothetical protein